MVYKDKISNVCPVFCKNIAIFVLNETIDIVAKWTEE